MVFSRIDSAINLALAKSKELVAVDPQMESFVTGYLIVDILSEFENRLEIMFALRAKKVGDQANSNFVAALVDSQFRTPKASKINEMLRKHDPSFVDAFNHALALSPQWNPSLDNLITARHYYVHKAGSSPTMTIRDVEQAYREAAKIFDAARIALGLTNADCAHLT